MATKEKYKKKKVEATEVILDLDDVSIEFNDDKLTCEPVKKKKYYTKGKGKQNSAYVKQMLKDEGIDGEWEVVVADDYHLQLDFDNDAELKLFKSQYEILEQFIGCMGYKITPSRSGNSHIIIELKKPLDAYKRIALQACLGSDRVRELLSYRGLFHGEKDPILLIEKKKK